MVVLPPTAHHHHDERLARKRPLHLARGGRAPQIALGANRPRKYKSDKCISGEAGLLRKSLPLEDATRGHRSTGQHRQTLAP